MLRFSGDCARSERAWTTSETAHSTAGCSDGYPEPACRGRSGGRAAPAERLRSCKTPAAWPELLEVQHS